MKEAHRLDARFLDSLLGDSLVRADQPIRFERGRNSTHSTARLLLPVGRSVPGATTWVRRVLRVPLGQADAVLPFPRKQLLDLSQQNASWQVGLRKLDPEQAGDEPCSVLGVADVRRKQMRCLTVIEVWTKGGLVTYDLLLAMELATRLTIRSFSRAMKLAGTRVTSNVVNDSAACCDHSEYCGIFNVSPSFIADR